MKNLSNNLITLKINDRAVQGQAGSTILQVARANDIRIPTLCYDPRLKPYGSCRLCLVEVNGARNPMLSCATEALDGIEVNTNSLTLFEIRRTIVELLLSDHPYDCLLCEKSGNCALQNLAYELQIDKIPFEGTKHDYTVTDFNPLIERDYQKCVLCGKCVRICREVQGWGCYDFANRGFNTIVTTPFDRSLTDLPCEFCGQCISTCPVGALTERQSRYRGRIWETKRVETVCPYCGVGCRLDLFVKDSEIVRVNSALADSSGSNSVNSGNLCVKGKFGLDFVSHEDRLVRPLIKKGKDFSEVSWEKALEIVTDKLSSIKEKYGPDSIAGLSSAKATNEENYLFQKFMRVAVGTNNVDHCARLCHASTVAGLAKAFGSGAMTNSISDLSEAKSMIIIGSNTTESHPIISLEIKKAANDGCKLIVIDPRRIEMVDYSTVWLRQKPGTDVVLLNGIMKVIIEEKLYDGKFIQKRTEGFEDLEKNILKIDLDEVENTTSVPLSAIREAARIFATASNASIVYSMGITQHTTGTDNVLAIANLAMLTGNIGRPGTGVNPLRGQNNVQGACDMGALPGLFPGYQNVSDKEVQNKFKKMWGVKKLPDRPGLTLIEMTEAARNGKVKAMYIMGENPMLSNPDTKQVKEALKSLDFLVVQDIFLTETAQLADVVLPAASFAEKDGTFTNTERRVQRVKKAFDPPGESKQDWEILSEVSSGLGFPMSYDSPREIFKELTGLTPSYKGMSYERLENGGLQWPCPTAGHPGTPILHTEKFSRGKGLFSPVGYRPADEEPDEKYPFVLTTGRIRWHYHTGTMTRRSRGINEICSKPFVEINPQDAEQLRVEGGDMVSVASRRGRIDLEVCVTERCGPGVVFIPFHFYEAAANVLTNPALDPVAKIPELKVCAVRIKKKGER